MLREKQPEEISIPEKLCISDEEYQGWQLQIGRVEIPDDIMKMITQVREGLKEVSIKENVAPLDYYVSDRRWRKIVRLLQAVEKTNGQAILLQNN